MVVGERAGDVEAAVRALGGEIAERVDWDAPPMADWRTIMLVEAQGVALNTLTAALPRLAEHDGEVVAAIDEAQIDAAAVLLGPRAQLLCAPTLAERIAAIALAVSDARGGLREGSDAARLARLHAEIARIAEMLARLSGRDDAVDHEDSVGDRRLGYAAPPGPPGAPVTPAEVRRTIRVRRLRDGYLGAGLFEDPAWDMLLDLYAAELEGGRVSVSSLCIAAAVAPTTALRWIGRMIEAGLLERRPDLDDRRRAFMALSARASGAMRGYFAAAAEMGVAIG